MWCSIQVHFGGKGPDFWCMDPISLLTMCEMLGVGVTDEVGHRVCGNMV